MSSTTKEEWPNIVEESSGLLLYSIFMYALPDLQSLASKKLLKDGDADCLTLPMKTSDLLNFCMKYKSELKAQFKPQELELYGTALFLAKEHIENMASGKQEIMDGEIVAFDAMHSKSELVYGIAKSDLRKTVTVMFRGTTTLKDVLVDADGFIVDCDNPLNPESKEKIGLHHGFLDYLKGTLRGRGRSADLDAANKYSEIMAELTVVFKECPGYRLYVTGHSLGASLAQLFAMEAAASHECIPKPVTVINFASPKVGNIFFRNCFEDLEDQGKLLCLRFCNDADIIPTLPDRQNCSFIRTLRCKPSVYRHAGPKVILHPGGEFEIRYEKRDRETKLKFMQEASVTSGHGVGFAIMVPTLVRYSKNFLTYHSCQEYMKRFHDFSVKRGGDKIFLNHIYNNQAALKKLLEA